MKNKQDHLQAIGEIRELMNRSSRFLSLSGLSGVCAGLFALAGAGAAYFYLGGNLFFGLSVISNKNLYGQSLRQSQYLVESMRDLDFYSFVVIDAVAVLVCALLSGYYFTWRRAKRAGAKLWDETSRRLLLNLMVPLATGGLFCLFLLLHDLAGLLAPTALVFYGLALFTAARYTLDDIRYLGLCQIALGFAGLFLPNYGLLLWALGFGVLHIVYGLVMYYRYERQR
jgi:hypothetical protein